MSWFWVFVGFSLLVIVHEAGHFVAAKATGMRVERFFLFFGPTIWSFKRGETEYGIKSIPLGGYVRITGMNPEEEVPVEVEHRAYYRQRVWKRIVVVAAGPAVNIALALAIFFVLALTSASTGTEVVHEVVKGSPAAGVLRPGDKIVAVDGKRYPGLTSGARIERFRNEIGSHECAGEQRDGCLAATPVTLTVLRSGDLERIRVIQPLAFAVFERQRQPAVDFGDLAGVAARLLQTVPPVAEAFFAGDAQSGARNAVAAAPLRCCRKIEECEVGAGIGVSVGVEQMIGADVVLIDGLLDQPHAEQAGIKRQILPRFRGNRGQMVNPRQLHRHYPRHAAFRRR